MLSVMKNSPHDPFQLIQLRVPRSLVSAVAVAASARLSTRSEFIRQALIDRVRADGLLPADTAQVIPTDPATNNADRMMAQSAVA